MNALLPNAMVHGQYLIVQLIGDGGSGEVYLAVDQWSGSTVAVKRTVVSDDKAHEEALVLESKVLLNLRHPVLPKVRDNFVENGAHFLVMEHISGDDLAKRLDDAQKPFPLSWCMFWADQLLDALTYLHSHPPPIIHRDIKPANLKLTDENHIVLLDHGLSKKHRGRPAEPIAASDGATPYASIEQVLGTGTSPASDVYSFSATLYQLMTNVAPADARLRSDALARGSADPLQSAAVANPDIPQDVSDVIRKGTEIDHQNRFASAADMQRELRTAFKKTQAAMTAQTVAFRRDEGVGAAPGPGGSHQGVAAPPLTMADPGASDQVETATVTRIENQVTEPNPAIDLRTQKIETGSDQDDVSTIAFSANSLSSAITENAQTPAAGSPGANMPNAADTTAQASFPKTQFQAKAPGPPPAAKKSGSKAGLIIGGMVGLLLMAAVVVGGGWYVYSNYYLPQNIAVVPTPTPAPVASPSPVEETVVDNSNANVVADSTNSAVNNSNRVTVTSSTPVVPETTRPSPQVPARTPAVRAAKTPATKSTQKPKAGDDRTDILQ